MTKRQILVDGVSHVVKPSERTAAKAAALPAHLMNVQFFGGQEGLLDMRESKSAVWAEVLESLRQTHQPAYVELDPDTHLISELHCPIVVGVAAIRPVANSEDLEVDLVISHARHYLRRSHANYERNLANLRSAMEQQTKVIVTETHDMTEIIDVRPAEQPEAEGGE
jgi:hypothetical protein